MTNMIRCDCGFVARESSAEDARIAAALHFAQSHPGAELDFNDGCWLVEDDSSEELQHDQMLSQTSDEFDAVQIH